MKQYGTTNMIHEMLFMQNITHHYVQASSQTDVYFSRRIHDFTISRDSTLSADKRDCITVTVRTPTKNLAWIEPTRSADGPHQCPTLDRHV